jgi:TonB-dependent SusC/RagA subfamily outer membrane receptor
MRNDYAMKKLGIQCLILLTAITCLSFVIQDDPLKKILTQLEKYRSEYFQEKVHLHLDKPYYALGDNIWFKAYVVGAEDHRLSALSRFLYVELINDKDSIKQSVKLPLSGGLAWGDFTLSDSLREGNYRIRAYTTWMRNFGEEYFYDRTISIGNSISNTILTTAEYTFSSLGNNQKVQAEITYTNLEGEPLANKEVNYNVQLNFRNVVKGKGITDSRGKLKLNFVNNQPFILKSGNINTTIKLNEKVTISKIIPVKATSSNVDLQFFPESGNLVNGLRSKVAFKAVGSDGLGVKVSGFVTDQNNNRLAEIKSEHAGMGSFALQPQEGETYSAVVRFEDHTEKSYKLPKPLNEGYLLSVNNLDTGSLVIRVAVSPLLKTTGELKLIASSNGAVYYASKSALDKNVFTATVDKKRFPTGILHLTLFSARNEPVAERLVFINHATPLSIQINSQKAVSARRDKVKLSLEAKEGKGLPVHGSFSMTVINESKVPFDEDNEVSILSNLLLTSDLKGYIEQPNYYFNNTDQIKSGQLDLLMLTQGWRRFTWKNILSNTFPAITFAPERTIQVSGTVTSKNGKPVAGGKVTLLSASGDVFLRDTLTNQEGRFAFKDLFFNDSTKFVIQARNQKDRKNVQIELDQIPPQLVTKNKNMADIETNVNQSLIAYLINSRKQYQELQRYGLVSSSILLAEVKIVEKKPLVKNSANLNGPGQADNILTAKDLEYATDLPSFLQGRVAGIVIRNGIAYSMRSMNSSFSGPVPMQLIIDGMYVSPDFLGSINPRDVESIEILKSASNSAIYGLRGGGGVLLINTKRGERNMSYTSYAPGIVSFKPRGLYISREFYSPNYDDPLINSKIADLRTTIFWQPNIITDSSGKAMVEYFNSDGTGDYTVIVEGITLQGEIGRSIYHYKVQ